MTLLLCGFAGFFVVQLVKTFYLPQKLGSTVKMVFALVVSAAVAGAIYRWHNPSDLVIYGVAGAGLAVLIHRIARVASTAGDSFIRRILSERGRR